MSRKVMSKIALLVIIAMLTAILGACGGDTGGTTTTAAPGETTTKAPDGSETTDAGNGEKVTLSFWHIQTQEKQAKIIQDSIDRFIADNPNYEVEVEPMQNDAFKTKLTVALGSNTQPDIFPHWSGGPMIEYAEAGKIADLTEYMNKDGYVDMFMPAGISQATYQDKIWAMPVENLAVAMFFYNKQVFADNGIEIPETLADLEAAAEKLKAAGIAPFSLANKTKWTGSMYYMYLVDRIGGADVFANAATRQNDGTFEAEAFTKAGEKIQEWVKKGYFNEGFNGLDEDSGQSRALLYSGQAAMTLMGSWIVSTITSENPDFLDNLGVFPFPAVEGGKGDPSGTVGTVGDNFYSISSECADIEGAFTALTYLLDEQAIKDRVADGKIPPINGVQLENPMMQTVLDLATKAKTNQLWYDQYLVPEMGDLHKDTTQELFGLTKTPEEVNAIMEAKAAELAG